MKAPRHGGSGRVSTKERLGGELRIVGNVLTAIRESAGVRQADLAERLGKPASYLSKIENGTRRVDVVEVIEIARALGVDPAIAMKRLDEALARGD